MTKLTELHALLADLRRRRQLVRWGAGAAALTLALSWTLTAAFVADWSFDMSRFQRFLLLLLSGGVFFWGCARWVFPWFRFHESEIDVALLVERQQKIDSDLVAAIQFESAQAPRWGSVQLQRAVIEAVADFSRGLNVLEGFSRKDLVHRASILGATLFLLGICVSQAPGHATAFLNRFFLGSAHYPTRTHIEALAVNGTTIEWSSGRNTTIRAPYGRPVRFEVHVSGDVPAEGNLALTAVSSGTSSSIALLPVDENVRPRVYRGEVHELVDSLDYRVHVGDAWTALAHVSVVALPVIEARPTVTPPAYAQAAATAVPPQSARQFTVLEGSRVDFEVACSNKQLTEVALTAAGRKYPLRPAAQGAGRVWVFLADNTPLAQVVKPLGFELAVTDADGLHLSQPYAGTIRIKADQPPRVGAAVVTRFVLPAAKPRIHYQVLDDFGISKVLIHLEVVHPDGTTMILPPKPMSPLSQPSGREPLPLKDAFPIELSRLQLTKGDQVKAIVEAVDYRGPRPGQSTRSEPLVLQVTDETGILEDVVKPDESSAGQLDAIIKQQLGIGGSK